MKDLYELTNEMFNTVVTAVKDNNTDLIPSIKQLKLQIEEKEKSMRDTHISRMAEGKCNATSGTAFIGIIADFKRICDHSMNISHLPQGRL